MDYDLAVIGAGWAGFNAAIKAKALNLKVALIEKGQIGGTCLNQGCIPAKTLIQSAKIYSLAKKSKVFGVEIANPRINFSEIQIRKNRIIEQLQKGMEFMLKGVDLIKGEAKFLSPNTLEVGPRQINANSIIIAAGSKPLELKNLKFDGKKIISSSDILNIKEIPKSLLIIGGGIIGCEFASLFSILGSRVSIAELTGGLLPGMDEEIAKKIENIFKKKGINIYTNTDAAALDASLYDLVLLCIGRFPLTEVLGLDSLNLKLEKAKIIVDEYLRTNIPNIYAIGDCANKIMLAHLAAYQGEVAAENIANPSNLKKAVDTNIPNCIFTDPEIASVGLGEEDAKDAGMDIKINKFDFLSSGMARILDETDGFIKIISCPKTEEILGSSIIGPRATELIGILTLAIQSRIKVTQIKEGVFAHPTLSEGIVSALKGNYGV